MTEHRRHRGKEPGLLATFNGVCDRCPEPVRANVDRIIPRPGGGYIHVGCASGANDG